MCLKRSSLHSPNSPDSLNSRKIRQTRLSRVWGVRATRFGECRRVWQVPATWLGECGRIWRVSHISENSCFGEYSHMQNLRASSHCLEITHNISSLCNYYYRIYSRISREILENNLPIFPFLTYTRVSNFGQNFGSKLTILLIWGLTYTRVYTVVTN